MIVEDENTRGLNRKFKLILIGFNLFRTENRSGRNRKKATTIWQIGDGKTKNHSLN